MAEAVASAQINNLLIEIGRSLLQYVSQIWPWSATGHEETRLRIEWLAADQSQDVAALAQLLTARGEIIDFGTFPTEYTSLHYVAVNFLLGALVRHQEATVRDAENLAREAEHDPEAGITLKEIAVRERGRLDELRRLASGA
ncbi:MAG: hypothetical protein KF861_14680 [Planctomycetaceae bacterium]|nr:hypothetical protein [Planctomycetaceae bacterium]